MVRNCRSESYDMDSKSVMAADFYTGVYQNLETKDSVSVTGDENNKTIFLSNGTEINVEYDSVSDNQLGLMDLPLLRVLV